MTHDFARQRAARASRAAKPAAPPWQWFVTGLVTGTLLSFLVYLATLSPLSTPLVQPGSSEPEAPPVKAPAAEPGPRPQFDFYTILPESEVIVGERSGADSPQSAAAAAQPADADAAKPSDAEPREPPAVEVPEPEVLMLQAGSFRQFADADRRRADIILLGYPARVETVTTAGGENWSRVQVGPFRDAKSLGEARGALRDQGIETLEIGKRG